MAHELFVYWRLEPHELPAAQRAMQAWQAALEAEWPGLAARVYRRADEAGSGHATLMETYARDGGIPPGLQADIVAEGLQQAAPWCRGPRHVEVFEPLER
jgi:hypothetical protein